MSIKSIADTYEEILSHGSPEKAFLDDELRNKLADNIEDFERFTETAAKIILERVEEKDFVRFMLMAQREIEFVLFMDGGESIVLADMDGTLQKYTHYVVLSVIGALIEDEVL